MRIGHYLISNRLILAPMAGVTDLPFRQICRSWGAGLAVAEMAASNPKLSATRKTQQKTDHIGEPEPRVAQIVGAEPSEMAWSARFNVERGAQIIDINMGCPAKKVCRRAAGSALLRDEDLVARILDAVVSAVDVPVTLKIRTGWDLQHRNAVTVAKRAESLGLKAITVHGRTRACGFSGHAEYDTIRRVKEAVSIPVIANGDIDTPEKAIEVLESTNADGLMIGRAALGQPWVFHSIAARLGSVNASQLIDDAMMIRTMRQHVLALHAYYGAFAGVRIARKHVGWYLRSLAVIPREWLGQFLTTEEAERQRAMLLDLDRYSAKGEAA